MSSARSASRSASTFKRFCSTSGSGGARGGAIHSISSPTTCGFRSRQSACATTSTKTGGTVRIPATTTRHPGNRSLVLTRHAVLVVAALAGDDALELGRQGAIELQQLRVVGARAVEISHLGEEDPAVHVRLSQVGLEL